MLTPAANSAISGTAIPAESGWTRCATREAGETFSPGSRVVRKIRPMVTPATVVWTPPLYISAQIVTPRGAYHHQPRTRSRWSR